MTTDSATRSLLKSYFQYGDTPTEAQFAELIDKLATVVELQAEEDARIAADTAETNARIAADNALDARIVSNDAELADIHTLLGTSANDTNLGSFNGSTLGDTSTVKAALQAIETYIEETRSQIQSNDDDIADLRTDLNAEISATNTDIANLNSDITNLTNDLNSEIATTDTEIAAHESRILDLESTIPLDSFIFACSSETGDIGTGIRSTFRMPYAFTCTEVRASLVANTASSPVELKVLVDGAAITDLVDIAVGSTTTYQAGVPSDFLIGQNSSPVSISMDSEVEVNVLAAPVGASGLKVTLVGYVGDCSLSIIDGNITFPITFPLGTIRTQISCSV